MIESLNRVRIYDVLTFKAMKTASSILTAIALAMVTPTLMADIISLGFSSARANKAQVQGNCDLMASNTVRASLVGQQDIPVPSATQNPQAKPEMARVAVFQVVEPLAYRRYVRFGDGQLMPGMQFTIAMNDELPGQPADNIDKIAAMQPGQEAIMRVDHLYLMDGQQGQSIRVCARLAVRPMGEEQAPAPTAEETAQIATPPAPAAPAAADAPAAAAAPAPTAQPAPLPTSVAPLGGARNPLSLAPTHYAQMRGSSSSVSITRDAAGNMQRVEVTRNYDSTTGQTTTRMFINGVEVDPQTRQPLAQPQAMPQPAPQPMPQPAAADIPTPTAEGDADAPIVEHNTAPIPDPLAPSTPAETAPTPAPTGDGF